VCLWPRRRPRRPPGRPADRGGPRGDAGTDAPPEGVRLVPGPRRRRLSLGSTLFERVWDAHVVRQSPDGAALLYVDLHLIHEVTSPQAFEGLRLAGRGVRRPDRSLATMDHN